MLGSAQTIEIIASLVGLVFAVFLLSESSRLRRVATGGVIAEKLEYVTLAVLCLAGSAVADWVANFTRDVTLAQMGLVSRLLVALAMFLLAVYFHGVRKGLQGFLRAAQGDADQNNG